MEYKNFTQKDYDLIMDYLNGEPIKPENQDIINAIIQPEEIFLVKDLSFDEKVLFVKCMLKCEFTTNANILTNLYTILFASNLSNDVFENESIWVSSLIEYLDLKKELKNEITDVYSKMVEYVIGAIKGYSKLLDDEKIYPTNLYYHYLSIFDIKVISNVFRKANVKTPYADIKPIMCAKEILDQMLSNGMALDLFKEFFEQEER